MGYVFVSYARDDSRKVHRVLGKLESHNIEYWLDTRDIKNGDDWAEAISKAIKNCRKIFLFMSQLSMASPNTAQEVKIAYSSHKKFVVLRLDDVSYPTKLKYALEGIQWTDYLSTDWETRIVSVLGGDSKTPIKPKAGITSPPAPSSQAHTVKSLSPQKVIAELEGVFSAHGDYYKDQCAAALAKLDDLRVFVGNHWVNNTFEYQELISRTHFLKKIEIVCNLIEDFQDTCPTGSQIKRQAVYNELKTLLNELSHKPRQ